MDILVIKRKLVKNAYCLTFFLQSLFYIGNYSSFPPGKIAFDNMFSCFAHQPKVEVQIVQTCDHAAEHFASREQVAQICP